MLTGDILRHSARRDPAKTAIVCDRRLVSYGELDRDANRFAHALGARGIGKGSAVAVMSRNVPEYAVVHFGNARSGCFSVNLMTAYGPVELHAILEKTRARLIVVEAAFQDKVARLRDRLPDLAHVVVIGAPEFDGADSFDGFIADSPPSPPPVELDEADPFAMTFTGGTTGLPKGALVSHRARFVSAYSTAIEHEMRETDVVGVVTPLYHAAGLLIWYQAAVLVGATCVFSTGWDAEQFIADAERNAITNALLIPVQLSEVLSSADFDAARFASLRLIASSGAIAPPEMIAEVLEKLPHAGFINHYGQSETGPICFLKYWHPRDKMGTVGRPALGVDLKVVDPAGKAVAPGEVGEIITSGPFMMEGYYDDPEETAIYFKTGDGWGWTGDLATMDADGFVTLVGRLKDMIVSGGVNIYPREVELVLEGHPAVAECTVFGIPDEKWGEALAAYVVPNDGAAAGADEDALIEHCAEHLARFKRPRLVRFVDAIPKTPSGKTLKAKIRDAFLKEQGLE